MEQEIIVIRPLSTEPSTHSTSFPPCCYGQATFPTPTPIFSITTTTTTSLPTPSFQDSFKNFSSPSPPTHSTPNSSPVSLSSPPSYSDFLSSLAPHTSMDRPVSSSSCTLTSSLPSSLPPSYSIYRPIPIYTPSRPSSLSMGCIPYLYSSALSTNTLSLSYQGSSPTRVSSTSSGSVPSGPKKRATSSQTRDWLRSWPRVNNYYTTRTQCPRPTTSGNSFPLLSSWANPSSYPDNPMNLTCNPRANLQAPGGSSSNPLFKSDFFYPHIYSPMVTFDEPSENVRGMFSFVLSCEFSPGANSSFFSCQKVNRYLYIPFSIIILTGLEPLTFVHHVHAPYFIL